MPELVAIAYEDETVADRDVEEVHRCKRRPPGGPGRLLGARLRARRGLLLRPETSILLPAVTCGSKEQVLEALGHRLADDLPGRWTLRDLRFSN